MADKVVLTSVDINVDEAIKDAQKLKQEIEKLKTKTDNLKKTQGETSKAYIESSAALKGTKGELRTQENLITKVSQANKQNAGTLQKLEAANAKLRNEQKSLNLATREGRKRNEAINKSINKNTEIISKNSDKRKQNTMNIGNYSSALGSSGVAINAATSAMKTFGTVLKIALGPIGLIIAAVGALIAYFKSSEEGQASFNKIMKITGVIIGNISDVIAEFGKFLFDAVTKPKEAWQKFKDFVKGVGEFFQNTFGNVIGGSIEVFVGFMQKAFAKVGLAWQKFKDVFIDNTEKVNKAQDKIDEFNKKIEEGQDRVKEGVENLGEGIKNAYDKAIDAVKDFVEETNKEINQAKILADLKLSTDRLERKLLVERKKIEAEVAEARLKGRQEEEYSNEQRLGFLRRAGELQDSLLEKELKVAKARLKEREVENSFSKSTRENLDEEARLRANVAQVEVNRFNQARQIERELQRIRRQVVKDNIDNLKAEVDVYKEANKDKFIDFNILFDKQKKVIEGQLENQLITQERFNAKLIKLENEKDRSIIEQNKAMQLANYENELELAEGSILAILDLERKGLEMKRQQEIEYAEKIGADVELINKKYAKANEEIAIAERDAKLSLAGGFAENIAQLLGKQTGLGKAAAIASTSVDTFRSATGAFTSFVSPPVAGPFSVPLGLAAAGTAIANGLANVKKILSVKSGLPGESSVGAAPISGGSSSQSVPVTGNINPEIGKGIVSRELSDTGIQQLQEESQKVVVLDEVTANQRLKSQQEKTTVL